VSYHLDLSDIVVHAEFVATYGLVQGSSACQMGVRGPGVVVAAAVVETDPVVAGIA
jgi:hypothetical protein